MTRSERDNPKMRGREEEKEGEREREREREKGREKEREGDRKGGRERGKEEDGEKGSTHHILYASILCVRNMRSVCNARCVHESVRTRERACMRVFWPEWGSV